MPTTPTKYKIYTDGATSNNGKEGSVGGWAWAMHEDRMGYTYFNSGHVEPATNNQCELIAAIEACNFADKYAYTPAAIYSDSSYIINCYKEKWYKRWQKNGWHTTSKRPVANQDLWERLIPYFENPLYTFEKVAGHAGIEENEFVDRLAVAAKEKN